MITVVLDDLAFVSADAVLRPADEHLAPATPAAARLDQHAGPPGAEQRRLSSPLRAGSAVVTGGGELAAPYVVHVVIREAGAAPSPEVVRRALVSAWQRAGDWGLAVVAAPLVGAGAGQLGVEESAALLVETFGTGREGGAPSELRIVVEREAEREMAEAVVRSTG